MTDMDKIFSELSDVKDSVTNAKGKLDKLGKYIEDLKRSVVESIGKAIEDARFTKFNQEYLMDFLAEPYLVLPKRTSMFNGSQIFLKN